MREWVDAFLNEMAETDMPQAESHKCAMEAEYNVDLQAMDNARKRLLSILSYSGMSPCTSPSGIGEQRTKKMQRCFQVLYSAY